MNKFFVRVSDIIGVIFDPRFWTRNYEVCHIWSDWLDNAMDEKSIVERRSRCLVKIKNQIIWVENWPYAYGSGDTTFDFGLPRRKTAIRLRRYILEQELNGTKD